MPLKTQIETIEQFIEFHTGKNWSEPVHSIAWIVYHYPITIFDILQKQSNTPSKYDISIIQELMIIVNTTNGTSNIYKEVLTKYRDRKFK